MFEFVAEKLLEVAQDAGISFAQDIVKDKITHKKYIDRLSQYLESQKKYNGLYSIAEEYDYEGLCDYFRGDGIEKIKIAISGTGNERKGARRDLYNASYSVAGAKTNKSKKKVRIIVSNSVEILRVITRRKISFEDKILAAEIEDTVNNHTDETIAESILEIKKEIQEASLFSDNKLFQLKNNADYKGIENLTLMFNNAVATTHEFYPYYRAVPSERYGGQLVSIPANEEAISKMPPKFVCKGTAKMGNKVLNGISPDDIEYADRHQLPIILTVTEAKKFLGEFEDPYQHEADSLEGVQFVKEPRKFEPAQPYCIKVGDVTLYPYIELGLVEILDDGTLAVTNDHQENAPIKVRLELDAETHKVNTKVSMLDKSNKNRLIFAKLMRAATCNEDISFYSLKLDTDFIRGCFNDCDYKSGFEDIDEEIDFMERICDLEKYFSKEIVLPQEIPVKEFNTVFYLSEIIRGGSVERTGDKFKGNGIVDEDFKTRLSTMSNEPSDYAFVGDGSISFIGSTFEFPILRIIKEAKIENIDKVRQLAALMDTGDNIPITIVSEAGCYVDSLASDEMVEKKNNFLENQKAI